MAAQPSKKAALPLAKIIATVSYRSSKTGPRVGLYLSDRGAREFHLFQGCNNPLAFQKHNEKLGQAHCSCRG